MASLANFTLTNEQLAQIKQWEREKNFLEGEIADRQRRLGSLNEKLKAVAILGVQLRQTETPSARIEAPEDFKLAADGSTMTDAIERIVNNSPEPMSKKELKAQLLAEKFSEDRLGAYFYTVIMRLKQKGRIRVFDNGRMWKPA